MAARLGLPRRRGVLHPLAARSVDSARVRHAGQEQDGFSLLCKLSSTIRAVNGTKFHNGTHVRKDRN